MNTTSGPSGSADNAYRDRPDPLPFPHMARDCEFVYFGHRTYIQGVIALDHMLDCARQFAPSLFQKGGKIRQAKIFREITTQAQVVCAMTSDLLRHPRLNQALARLDMQNGEERLTALLFGKPNFPVTERALEYDFGNHVREVGLEADSCSHGHMEGMRTVVDLICGVEECFRDIIVLERGLPQKHLAIRWAYAEDFPLWDQDQIAAIRQVRFSPSQTILSASGIFDIRKGSFPDTTSNTFFTMCFHVVQLSAPEKEHP